MKSTALRFLVCPACKSDLALQIGVAREAEILEGGLRCRDCDVEYAIRRGVPRFVDDGTYAASFGRQWHWFRTVQLDSQSGSDESARTLQATTGWTDADYQGRLVLDAGVGAGR